MGGLDLATRVQLEKITVVNIRDLQSARGLPESKSPSGRFLQCSISVRLVCRGATARRGRRPVLATGRCLSRSHLLTTARISTIWQARNLKKWSGLLLGKVHHSSQVSELNLV